MCTLCTFLLLYRNLFSCKNRCQWVKFFVSVVSAHHQTIPFAVWIFCCSACLPVCCMWLCVRNEKKKSQPRRAKNESKMKMKREKTKEQKSKQNYLLHCHVAREVTFLTFYVYFSCIHGQTDVHPSTKRREEQKKKKHFRLDHCAFAVPCWSRHSSSIVVRHSVKCWRISCAIERQIINRPLSCFVCVCLFFVFLSREPSQHNVCIIMDKNRKTYCFRWGKNSHEFNCRRW